jgi:hypothetical protein
MFKRLLVVVLFAAAVSAAQPAHASTLTLNSLMCSSQSMTITCVANASGGTGSYTYYWRMYKLPDATTSTFQTITNTIQFACRGDEFYRLSVTVKDSSGTSTASMSDGVGCD